MKHLPSVLVLCLLSGCAAAAPPLMWEYKITGSIYTDVAVDGGVVYFATTTGKVYGLNGSTGRLVMNYTSTTGIYSTPAVAGDMRDLSHKPVLPLAPVGYGDIRLPLKQMSHYANADQTRSADNEDAHKISRWCEACL